MKSVLIVFIIFVSLTGKAFASADTIRRADLERETDVGDIRARMFHQQTKLDTAIFKFRKLFIPSFSYNPSAGFELGLSVSALKFLGHPDSTTISTGEVEVSASTKGLAAITYKHNVYLPKNKWSLQGNWQVARTLALDYGVGTGRRSEYSVLSNAPADDIYQLKYTSFKFRETAYKKIEGNFYGGIGLILNAYTGIDEERRDNTNAYHYQYSAGNNFPLWHYLYNAFTLNLQYDSRDHPNRPYKGIYANLGFKAADEILGSSQNATQLITEFRKYWSLSANNPQHVLAFWHWGSYLLSGKIPYLELPGTSGDNDGRSGRAYTVGRFKGFSFFYSETEYRFPISANKLLSGVAFVNAQTGSNTSGILPVKLFRQWEPGGGIGLRILYNKYSRSNICVDYGVGKYGSSGFFINLNETF
ncbi:MAG: BamA/TamA family outer membrane protein [Bacteroidota bacterium]